MTDLATTIGLLVIWAPVLYVLLLVIGHWWWLMGSMITEACRSLCYVLLLEYWVALEQT